jgi:ADP-ribose pyrophosphatase
MTETDQHNRILAWQHLYSEPGPDLTVCRVRFDWVENPRNAHRMKATVLEVRDWVNVVALTPDGKLVVVEQYRFGAGKVTTEVPAGILEPGEDHQQAAMRELREETGYTSENWMYLGWVEPNPAFMNNHCHHWVARDVRCTHPPELDDGEAIVVRELSVEEVREHIQRGEMRSSLGLLALAQVLDIRMS